MRLVLFIILLCAFPVQAAYVLTELEATPLDVPDNVNFANWDNTDTSYPNDDDKQVVNIGFNFTFDNTEYSQVRILTNGMLQFGTNQRLHRDWRNEPLATNEGDRIIAVYWDDLVDDALGQVTYGNAGVAPNRRFIVNWTNVRAYDNNLRYDFQVVLYENGDIRYRYNNNTANGESATIGLEINDTDFIQYSYNQISVATSFDLLFRNTRLILPDPVAEYRFDEAAYDGSAGEVVDSSGNGLNGNALNALMTNDALPARPGVIGSCRYGEFNGSNQYAEIADNNLLDFQNEFSAAAWIKIDSIPASGLKTILSKDENYEFHVNPSGQINWWWNTSAGSTREFNSTATITAGVWTHVAVSYQLGNQVIYINGVPAGSNNRSENLRQNSDPLQIGSDQNFAGRQFNGDIDEVNLFDQFLTQNQVQELIDKTRPCEAANLCVASFPDGISTHADNGEITFGRDSQLFFSPDDRLNASAVNLDGASVDRSCVAVECQANSVPVPTTDAPPFPDTTSFTTDETIGNSGVGAIGGTTNEYRNVTVGNSGVLGTFTGRTDFYIDRLQTGNNVVLNLVAANYWIRDLDLGEINRINVIGSGTVRLYLGSNSVIGRDLIANSDGADQARDASQLLIYGYGSLAFERDSTVSGTVYAAGDLSLDRDSFLYGAAAGANVSLGRDTNVYYLPSAVAGTDFAGLCEPASCNLGSFLINQPDVALACPFSRAAIQLQAMCDDGSSPKEDYAGTINLTTNENALSEFYLASAGGNAISSVTLDGSEAGSATVYLYHQNENAALAVTASDNAASVSSTSTDTTDFRSAGFRLSDADAGQVPNNFVCGGTSRFTLTAIGEDSSGTPCQTLTGFNGDKQFKAWFETDLNNAVAGPESASSPLTINSTDISAQVLPGSDNLTLNFNNGSAAVVLQYNNTAQFESLNLQHDTSPYGSAPLPASLSTSVGPFVASPDRVNLSVTTANSSCPSGNHTCSAFVAAGQSFSMTATAQCSNGATASDYLGDVALSHGLLAPAGGQPGGLATSTVTFATTDNGTLSFNQSISEVGVFQLTASAEDYFSQPVAASTLTNIGRFYPAELLLTAPAVANACGAGSVPFSYMGHDAITLQFTLSARNGAATPAVTQNYQGDFAFADTLTLVAENDNDGAALGSRLLNVSAANWVNGIINYSDSDIAFSRAAAGPDGPYPDLQLGLQLSGDSDVSLSGLNMDASSSGNCAPGCNALQLGSLDVRFGSMYLANAFGPETMDLQQRIEMRYFDGSRFSINQADSACLALASGSPPWVAESYGGDLAAGETAVTSVQPVNAGIGSFTYRAPGVGNSGTLSMSYQAPPWLDTEYGTNGNSNDYEEDPKATLTFGQFRGHDRVIYWREVIQEP